jgi:hypothetical protein
MAVIPVMTKWLSIVTGCVPPPGRATPPNVNAPVVELILKVPTAALYPVPQCGRRLPMGSAAIPARVERCVDLPET